MLIHLYIKSQKLRPSLLGLLGEGKGVKKGRYFARPLSPSLCFNVMYKCITLTRGPVGSSVFGLQGGFRLKVKNYLSNIEPNERRFAKCRDIFGTLGKISICALYTRKEYSKRLLLNFAFTVLHWYEMTFHKIVDRDWKMNGSDPLNCHWSKFLPK